MKIVAIVQLFNEVTTGYLEQFCKYNLTIFDEVVAYDDGSFDGTASYCRDNGITVISSTRNDFCSEVFHKSVLIEHADRISADFIVSLDADEILVCSRQELESLCSSLITTNGDGLCANFINLWRSNCYKRVDSLFDEYKPVKLWRHQSGIVPFSNPKKGLHQRLCPDYVKNVTFSDKLVILHTGFVSIDHIMDKFVRYRSKGQSGFELMRFVDESNLRLEKVDRKYLPVDWQVVNDEPKALSIQEYFNSIEGARERVFRPKVTIFSLIYKDINWLEFMYKQLVKATPLDGVEFYFIANDADDNVISYMKENYIPFYEFKNTEEHRKEHYINNVYRAYNYGVSKAKGAFVLMLNSDMAFSEGWLEALLDRAQEGVCISSRLVEHGKLRTGKHGIEKDFGSSWENFDEHAFHEYARSIRDNRIEDGGLYMPLLVRKSDFLKVDGYPEGNIVPDSDLFHPKIAKPGEEVISGDTAFISKLESIGVRHVTAFNSIVYHFQEGEKRAQESPERLKTGSVVAICNNRIQGINGEKVLWGHLLDLPNTLALDYDIVGGKTSESFEYYVKEYGHSPSVILQNATFVPRFFTSRRTLMYLQDNLRAMNGPSALQETNLRSADCLVTNTVDTAASYPEYDFDICPVGVDSSLFIPMSKVSVRSKYGIGESEKVGIFVGALDDVKGWPEVFEIIESEPELSWIVVTKYDDQLFHPRIRFFTKQAQSTLVELLNCADFFILGSPVETQCLAAIEAALCDIPVVIRPVGIFSSFTNEEKSTVGCVGENLHQGVKDVLEKQRLFSPRNVMISKGLTLESTSKKWWDLFARENMRALSEHFLGHERTAPNFSWKSKIYYQLEVFYRFRILKPLIKRDTFYSVAEVSVFVKNNMPKPVHRILRFIWRLARGRL